MSIFSESIFWSSDKYRNCLIDLIVWDRSTGAPINCFCLFVYSCCFPPCKICVRDTGIKGTICLWNAKSRDLESVILLEESEILLMIGICTLTAMVMVFRSRCSNFWPYRLKIWPRLWRSNFWPVLLTDLLNARIFNWSKICPPFVRCHVNEVCI